MNILHITTAFQRSKSDIITPWLVNLLKEQSKDDSVFVLTSGYGNISSRQRIGKIEIHRFNYAPKRQMKMTHDMTIQDYIQKNPFSIIFLKVFFIAGIIKCIQIVKEKNIDVIVVHWPFPLFFIALPAKLIFEKKIVSVFYGAELKLFKSKFKKLKFIFRYICKSSNSVIAISNATADEVKELSGLKKVTVIPYGVKLKEWRDNKKENMILTVGRQVERKGTKYLIRAMKMTDSAYKLVIVGEGPLISDLKKITVQENLSDRVIFTGWIRDEALEEYYKKAKIFVLPAVYDSRGDTEGLGMVLVEAMMHGAVCVATGIGGITDIIKDGETGLFSKEKDSKDIAEKINTLLNNTELNKKIKNKAYENSIAKFSLEGIEKRYKQIINQ